MFPVFKKNGKIAHYVQTCIYLESCIDCTPREKCMLRGLLGQIRINHQIFPKFSDMICLVKNKLVNTKVKFEF